MRNLPVVIWLICFPVGDVLSSYVYEYLLHHTYSTEVKGLSALLTIFTWVFVGYLTYEGKNSK